MEYHQQQHRYCEHEGRSRQSDFLANNYHQCSFQKKTKNNLKRKLMTEDYTPAKKLRRISDEKSPMPLMVETPQQVNAS